MHEELLKAACLLKTVKVDGDYWLIMQAVYNSIVTVANKIREGETKVESVNNGT